MISKDKKYTTKEGLEFKIYEIYPDKIHGAYKIHGSWIIESILPEGLIEVSPYADFKIDDKVLVWDNEYPSNKYKRYFAGISSSGMPTAWVEGATSFSVYDNKSKSYISTWDNCIKYEENNDN